MMEKNLALIVGNNRYKEAIKHVVFKVLRKYGLESSSIGFY